MQLSDKAEDMQSDVHHSLEITNNRLCLPCLGPPHDVQSRIVDTTSNQYYLVHQVAFRRLRVRWPSIWDCLMWREAAHHASWRLLLISSSGKRTRTSVLSATVDTSKIQGREA